MSKNDGLSLLAGLLFSPLRFWGFDLGRCLSPPPEKLTRLGIEAAYPIVSHGRTFPRATYTHKHEHKHEYMHTHKTLALKSAPVRLHARPAAARLCGLPALGQLPSLFASFSVSDGVGRRPTGRSRILRVRGRPVLRASKRPIRSAGTLLGTRLPRPLHSFSLSASMFTCVPRAKDAA